MVRLNRISDYSGKGLVFNDIPTETDGFALTLKIDGMLKIAIIQRLDAKRAPLSETLLTNYKLEMNKPTCPA